MIMRLFYTIFFIFFISQSYACIIENFSVIAPSYNKATKAPEPSVKIFSEKYCDLAASIPNLRPSVSEWLKIEEKSKDNNRRMLAWQSIEYAQRETKNKLDNICTSSKAIVNVGQINTEFSKEFVIDHLLFIAETMTNMNLHNDLEELIEKNKVSLNKKSKDNVRLWCTAATNRIISTVRQLN